MNDPFKVTQVVTSDMIDYNGHVHDANYNMVFSEAINQFNYIHGLSLAERKTLNYTLFTVEEQTAYLSELTEGDVFTTDIYIYDYNEKSVHFFSIMSKQDGTNVATNEAMMLGIDRTNSKTAPFPDHFAKQISHYYDHQQRIDWPKQLGHRIRISR